MPDVNDRPKLAVLVADAFQDSEYFGPKAELEKFAELEVVSVHGGTVEMYSFFDRIGEMDVDVTAQEADADDYIGVLIPGGADSPATLAADESVLDFLRALDEKDKMVASICRGSLPVAVSGIAEGRPITGYYLDDPDHPDQSIRETVESYGGQWNSEQPVIVDDNLITSRHPDDALIFTSAAKTWLQGMLCS